MYIGHFAVGVASKRLAPKLSLGWLLLAPLLPDLLLPIFQFLGLEQSRFDPTQTVFLRLEPFHYPWSHSLLMSVVWSVLLGAIVWGATRDRRGALVVAAGVASHWVLDFITHRADLALTPAAGSPKFGLELWSSVPATVSLEVAMTLGALWLYSKQTRAKDRVGSASFMAFGVALLVAYAATVAGPPVLDVNAAAAVTLSWWLVPVWVAWFDRHREVVGGPSTPGSALRSG